MTSFKVCADLVTDKKIMQIKAKPNDLQGYKNLKVYRIIISWMTYHHTCGLSGILAESDHGRSLTQKETIYGMTSDNLFKILNFLPTLLFVIP